MIVCDFLMNLLPKTSWKKRFTRNTSTDSVHIEVSSIIKLLNLHKTDSGHLIDRWTSLEYGWVAMIVYIHYNIIDFLQVLLS